MDDEQVSWTESSFTTASPCSATVLSYGTVSESDCDSELDRLSDISCETAVAPLSWVDSLELLRSRCDLTQLVYPHEETSEVVLTFSDSGSEIEFSSGEDSDWTQQSSDDEEDVLSCYQLAELNEEQLLCQAASQQKALDEVDSDVDLSCN